MRKIGSMLISLDPVSNPKTKPEEKLGNEEQKETNNFNNEIEYGRK